MNEEVHGRRQRGQGKSIITPAEVTELRRLYGELPNAAAAARHVLGINGRKPLVGVELARFLEADTRISEIFERIKAITT
jgi:hypothetical protein